MSANRTRPDSSRSASAFAVGPALRKGPAKDSPCPRNDPLLSANTGGHHMPSRSLDRRTFLHAAGVSIALPFLDAMMPAQQPATPRPRRLVLIGRPLGFHAPYF